MRTLRAVLLSAAFALSLAPVSAHADPLCDESEGCSPCPPPRVVIDGKNTRIEVYMCAGP